VSTPSSWCANVIDGANLVIRGATRLEPGQPRQEVDAVIENGRLVELKVLHWGSRRADLGAVPDPTHPVGRQQVIEAAGMYLAPGFLDLHTHLREPGQEHKETIGTGAAAAVAGGFTSLVAMANTSPPVDRPGVLRDVLKRSRGAPARVSSVAAVTVGLAGRELTDMEALAEAGAVAFSDDGRNAYGLELATEAGHRAAALNRAILVHAQDETTCPDGQANDAVASSTGLRPWPCDAEVAATRRAVEACRRSGGRLHLQHLSCSGSLEVLAQARADGLPVTAEVTPHHLVLTEGRVLLGIEPDPMAKVNPPLRSDHDRRALVAALQSGLIDAVATDHAPHDRASKEVEFSQASFGFSGLETALSLCLDLVEAGELSLDRLVDALTVSPWRCLTPGLAQPRPGLRIGELADLVLFETKGLRPLQAARMLSRGKNTPLEGREMRGRVLLTVARGELVHSDWFAGVT
jgi:dihydroorotase